MASGTGHTSRQMRQGNPRHAVHSAASIRATAVPGSRGPSSGRKVEAAGSSEARAGNGARGRSCLRLAIGCGSDACRGGTTVVRSCKRPSSRPRANSKKLRRLSPRGFINACPASSGRTAGDQGTCELRSISM
jgi:hypothetical protein